jgi:hypothetical protein
VSEPGLFDDPRTRALAERERLVAEEQRLLEEWGGLDPVAPARRTAIDVRLREIRTRLGKLRELYPPEPKAPAAKRTRRRRTPAPVHDGRMAATGERD